MSWCCCDAFLLPEETRVVRSTVELAAGFLSLKVSVSKLLGFREEGESKVAESYEYDLIGVTVHTGTADGGHYYSFIRDIVNPHAYKNNKW